LCRLKRGYLLLLTLLSAAAICFVGYHSGNLLGGWSGPTFWDGSARISYSFLAGLLIYRSNLIIKSKLGFTAIALLLVLAFIVPFSKWNWLVEPLIVLFYFPLLIALGAGATLKPFFKRICVFLGRISYPLYMTHYAALWMFGNYYTSHKPKTIQLAFIVSAAVVMLAAIAYLVMIIYDEPVRKYLNHRRTKKGWIHD